MQVGADGAATLASDAEHRAAGDGLARSDRHALEMPVERAVAVAVVDDHGAGRACAAVIGVTGEGHHAISSGEHLFRRTHAVVPAGMAIIGEGEIGLGAAPVGEQRAILAEKGRVVVEERGDREVALHGPREKGSGWSRPGDGRLARVVEEAGIAGDQAIEPAPQAAGHNRRRQDAGQHVAAEGQIGGNVLP